jgi:hypothetical protein
MFAENEIKIESATSMRRQMPSHGIPPKIQTRKQKLTRRQTHTSSLASVSAPAFKSSRTQSARPSEAARISAVRPLCAEPRK